MSIIQSAQLVDKTALDHGETDLILTIEQAERMDATVLRRFAAASESEQIHGKSTKLEILSFLTCQYTLSDFAN